jgi:hypothetical protein
LIKSTDISYARIYLVFSWLKRYIAGTKRRKKIREKTKGKDKRQRICHESAKPLENIRE